MAATFGRYAFGAGIYSRDPFHASVVAGSAVGVRGEVMIVGRVSVGAASGVSAQGRLLWDRVPVPPCETWPSIPAAPPAWAPIAVAPCAEWPRLGTVLCR